MTLLLLHRCKDSRKVIDRIAYFLDIEIQYEIVQGNSRRHERPGNP